MEKQRPFHEQLRYEREVRGWSQEDLAVKVSSDAKTVGRWESGKSLPRPYSRQRLCELFGKNAEELGLLSPGKTESDFPQSDAASVEMLSSASDYGDPANSTDYDGHEKEPAEPEPQRPAQGSLFCSYNIHASWVLALDWSPDGARIASTGGDGTVQVWEAGTCRHLLTYRGHAPKSLLARTKFVPTLYAVAWSPTGQQIASCGSGKTVHVWDADTGATSFIYRGHAGFWTSVYAMAWSPDGRYVASACSGTGGDKTVHVWDVKTGRTVVRYDTHLGLTLNFSVLALAWSPDGTRIASTCEDKTIRIWSAASGEELSRLSPHADWVSSIAWSPDGRLLAAANSDSTVQIWDTIREKLILTYSGHSDGVRDVAWSPDGRRIASASNDRTVQIWNPGTGGHIFTYEGHKDWATSVAWSPDGRRIVSGSNDRTVKVWRAG